VLGEEIADFTGGFNGWHSDVIQGVCIDRIRSEGYSFQIELKCRAAQSGFAHREFPIVFDERRAGKSKMSTAIACEAVWRIWTFRASARASNTQTESRRSHP
jgi:dolichol-phosphate mannosyltransferase